MDARDTRRALVGLWRLLSYEDREDVGEPWVDTFGEKPSGLILYDDSGLMAVHVAASSNDAAASWRYVGYFGTFEVREAEREGEAIVGVVLHRMEAAEPPELLSEEPERVFRVQGDELILGDGLTARRVFMRVGYHSSSSSSSSSSGP